MTGLKHHKALWFIVICASVFLLRSIYTAPPEINDAKKKWIIANQIAKSGDFKTLLESDHHSSRWGIILPTALAIKLGGRNYITYYSLTLGMYAVVFAMLIFFAQRAFSPGFLVLFSVLLFYEPMFFRASSQLQPFVFGIFYLTLSLWLLSRYINSKKMGFLFLAGVFAFLAYGTKETYLFFVAGLVLMLYIQSGIRPAIGFCGILLALFAAETVVFNQLSGHLTLGRIEFLSEGKHLDKMPGRERYGFPEFLTRRWVLLPGFDQIISAVSGCLFLYLLLTAKWIEYHPLTLGVLLMALCYAVLVTIFPLSFSPFIPIQPLKVKYLTPLMPFFVFAFVFAIQNAICSLRSQNDKWTQRVCVVFSVVFAAYCLVFDSPFRYEFRDVKYPEKIAMMWKAEKYQNSFRIGHGVCDSEFRDILVTQNMIRNYFNEQNLLEDLTISGMDNYKVLHSKNLNPETLESLSAYPKYFTPINAAECART